MSEPACPRCAGLVAGLYDDPHCLNCGWRRCEPVAQTWVERAEKAERAQGRRRPELTRAERNEKNRACMLEYWRRKRNEAAVRARASRGRSRKVAR